VPSSSFKSSKNLQYLKKNQLALIIADDPLAEIDLRHFCDLKSYILENVSKNSADEKKYYEIKRKN